METIKLTNINVYTVSFDIDGVSIKYTVRDSHKDAKKHVHADCNPVGHTDHNGASYVICEDADGYRAINEYTPADKNTDAACGDLGIALGNAYERGHSHGYKDALADINSNKDAAPATD